MKVDWHGAGLVRLKILEQGAKKLDPGKTKFGQVFWHKIRHPPSPQVVRLLVVSWEEADCHAAGLVRMKVHPEAGGIRYRPKAWETRELQAATRAFLEHLPAPDHFYQYARLARELLEVNTPHFIQTLHSQP